MALMKPNMKGGRYLNIVQGFRNRKSIGLLIDVIDVIDGRWEMIGE